MWRAASTPGRARSSLRCPATDAVWSLLAVHVGAGLEPGELLEEGERHVAGGPVALLGDDECRLALGFLFLFVAIGVVLFAHEEAHHVGILLDAAGFAEVAQPRPAFGVAGALFGISV